MDLEERVISGIIAMELKATRELDLEDLLLAKLCGPPGQKSGVAIRWAITIKDDNSLALSLQGRLTPPLTSQ